MKLNSNSSSTPLANCSRGRREPNVSPGPAQIWRISGFVKSKTDGQNAAVWFEIWCDLQKKGLHRNSNGFSGRIWVISKKKASLKSMGAGVIVPPCLPLSAALIIVAIGLEVIIGGHKSLIR